MSLGSTLQEEVRFNSTHHTLVGREVKRYVRSIFIINAAFDHLAGLGVIYTMTRNTTEYGIEVRLRIGPRVWRSMVTWYGGVEFVVLARKSCAQVVIGECQNNCAHRRHLWS